MGVSDGGDDGWRHPHARPCAPERCPREQVKPRRASSASPGRGLSQFQPRASARLQPVAPARAGPPLAARERPPAARRVRDGRPPRTIGCIVGSRRAHNSARMTFIDPHLPVPPPRHPWERDYPTIQAFRIGPPRALPALAPARNRPGGG